MIQNLRDLGGIQTVDGAQIREGMLIIRETLQIDDTTLQDFRNKVLR